MTWKLVVTSGMATLLVSTVAWGAATTYYVATNGSDSTSCGATAAPCKTIAFAIAKTAPGDTILVRAGTYAECILIAPGTGTGGITVEAESFATSQIVGSAILDGKNVCDGGGGTSPGPVVTVFDGSSLRGFSVKDGGDSGVWGLGAVNIANNWISHSASTSVGGGIYLSTGPYLSGPLGQAVIDQNTVDSNSSEADGAGIYVDGSAANGIPSVVLITGNTVTRNTTTGAVGAFGGGISVFTDTAASTDTSTVKITTNTIDGNTASNATSGTTVAYGGGIFVATGGLTGAGTETITVGQGTSGNIVRNNISGGYGGGISVNLQPVAGSLHSIVVEGNSVTANTAKKGGGGIHAYASGLDLIGSATAEVRVQDNVMTGNHAQGVPSDPYDTGGGGLFAEEYANRSSAGVMTFRVARNRMTANDSSTLGGGATLLVVANDEFNGDGVVAPSDATLEFTNNLVAGNTAHDATTTLARGGGVYALVEAFGDQATAAADHDFLTVAANATDSGSGGLEWDAIPGLDSLSTSGSTSLSLTNSIIVRNQAIGVGGGVTPGPGVTVDITYDDAFANTGTDWEAQLGVTPGTTPGVIQIDPKLDAAYNAPLCSSTIDMGDPAASTALEPQPNGGLVNLGHSGGLAQATRTFPDINGDKFVDGLDILALAVSFNAVSPDPRFLPKADLDRNKLVDGLDLSYLVPFYAQACPP